MARRAPNLRECLAEAQLQSIDMNLAKVIAKALEKDRTSRQVLRFGGCFLAAMIQIIESS